ncbi:bifunctional peptidase and arginyl-hydroxylase JMJD5-like isoform X2 [Rhopilema esculentum]|uniref:bifunctional peptidase and arginyl-hydroxylase JMJD5-like isoform X2 n=1 Tax=Rhopilema esculentum TaxID=499914 RepID=UPI0031CDC38D
MVKFFLFHRPLFLVSFLWLPRKRSCEKMDTFYTLLSLYLLLGTGFLCNAALKGHLERLGLQRTPEGHVDILTELPSPVEFFEKYVTPGRPAVFKGAAKKMPAFKKWDDEYLRTNFADLKFDVEEGKKENRSLRTFVFTMKEFVDKYKTEDVYMVHSIQKEMRGDVTLLPTLTCGGYVNLLQDIVMWFSSGGTKSVLHADNVDNINCLFSGEKELYMVDKNHQEHIDIDEPNGGYSKVNPDAVDLDKYPGIASAPWWEAKMEAGDCLFIPLSWFHQVRSYNRNIAVNVWFTHPLKINESDCDGKDWKDNYIPLKNYKLKSNDGARQLLALEVKAKGKISKKNFSKFLMNALQGQRSEIKEVTNLADKNNDNYITMEDIDALTEKDLKKIRQMMPMGADIEEEGDEEENSDGEEAEEGAEEDKQEQPDDGFPEDEEEAIEEGVDKKSNTHTEL